MTVTRPGKGRARSELNSLASKPRFWPVDFMVYNHSQYYLGISSLKQYGLQGVTKRSITGGS